MIIENTKYHRDLFHDNDLYIFAVGYEQRSYYLYDRLVSEVGKIKSLIFVFDDYADHDHSQAKIEMLKDDNIEIVESNYFNAQDVHLKVIQAIEKMIVDNDKITVHIDYSSMPRSWYCRLPSLIQNIIREDDCIYFWYSEGEYPDSYEEYPSAGIDAFTFFSGKPSLHIDNNRVHILALGYDKTRTQAIISIVDPNYLVSCYAYNPERDGFAESLKEVNAHILARSAISLALHLDDFSFMIAKLRETANELLPTGDVILIPDGPKPLIFAMSLIPDFLPESGLTCLHVARNSAHFKAIDVTPTKIVYGFSIRCE